jgi:hypothetical protein
MGEQGKVMKVMEGMPAGFRATVTLWPPYLLAR